ncbi:MAG: class I SAM-dependent methyltransferase [Candidatus Neomarinimicrobiota bacterium]
MNFRIRSFLKRIAINFPIFRILRFKSVVLYSKAKMKKARQVFERSSDTPPWLEPDHLEFLQRRYPFPPEYGYRPVDLERRGRERSAEILTLLSKMTERRGTIRHFLELGCWDGMVSHALQRSGKVTTAIDHRSEGFDKRALRRGVSLLKMDAEQLGFEDESFDCIFSYESFEHFSDPEAVLREAIRVVRKGGFVYLAFGPLYMSPMGLHAYRSITVPYCHFLFPLEVLDEFCTRKSLTNIHVDELNRWSLNDYRELWEAYAHRVKKVLYREIPDTSHVDVIIKHPSCFRSKTDAFDNLVVSTIEVLFVKMR